MANIIATKAATAVLVAGMSMGAAPDAVASGANNVENFTDRVEQQGDPNLKGGTQKYGRQLYADSEPVTVTAGACSGQNNIFYREDMDKGKLVGTFWATSTHRQGESAFINTNGMSGLSTAAVEPGAGYIQYDVSNSPLSTEWKDVVSPNVDVLRLALQNNNRCPSTSNKSDPTAPTPPTPEPEPEELPGGGCQGGCAVLDVKTMTLDPLKQNLIAKTFSMNIG